jgi:hypothetical protein
VARYRSVLISPVYLAYSVLTNTDPNESIMSRFHDSIPLNDRYDGLD